MVSNMTNECRILLETGALREGKTEMKQPTSNENSTNTVLDLKN